LDPVARAELLDALEYLEEQQAGLGKRLAKLTRQTIIDIRDHPERFPVVHGRYRRARVDPFRYAIVYAEEEDGGIFVVAFFHLSRNPKRLRRRLGESG
jgi:plasmid stabilization system protein ParE